ncbi:DUF2516 family protein [Streptosporangiaceae bacterium NEAU-GS5]|nr:DUF2516 family protein [Streptosporangiaceae bacterium NEAU-GS5]
MSGTYNILTVIFLLLGLAAFVMTVIALFHAIRTPPRSFAVAGKQTKQLWLIILGFAALFTFAAAVGYIAILGSGGIFVIAAVIASGIYLADVKPAVNEYRGGGGNNGPYGPW